MEIIDFDKYLQLENSEIAVAIGQFDGFHLAHQVLLEKVLEIGKEKKCLTGIITFNPHPDFVLGKTNEFVYLTSIIDKAKILAHLGFDYMIVINFTKDVARISPKEFIDHYLKSINVKEVVVGFDFSFGNMGSGKADMIGKLSNNSINVTIIDEITFENQKLGTTLIKSLLSEGKVELVTKVLGRPYRIEGKVVSGRKIGRTVSFPTANIHFLAKYVKVKKGVYAVIVEYKGKKYLGIANYGNNPSFNYRANLILEVHLIDFVGDLYGEYLKVDFIEYLRDEIKFNNKEEFILQVSKDKEKAIKELMPYFA